MATGDDATAQGWTLVSSTTGDVRDGATEINKTRDYAAQVKTWATTQLSGKAASSHTHAASAVTSGTFDAARIPNLPASIITSGTFATAQIPNHSAAKITSGTLDSARLDNDVKAQGPTSGSYGRSATGSSWYQVWMNSDLLFMRNTSSRRYKENIETLTTGDALDMVTNLRPVFYTSKASPEMGRHVGLIAEEVAEVVPEVVPLEDGKPEAVNYEFLVAPLIGAVQELVARIAALETKSD